MKKTSKVAKYKQEETWVDFNQNVKLTSKQQALNELVKKNKITLVTGPAGTAKTFTACYAASELLRDGLIKKIYITKPTETIGSHDLGALPGTLDEKLNVYLECFIHNFKEIIEGHHLKNLLEEKIIEFKPVQYIRGLTFKDCVLIIDESQTFDIKELMAIVTRLGSNCKMLFLGDVNQNDIDKKYVGLNIFKEIIQNLPLVSAFEFERKDIMRDPLLIEITDRYEKIKDNGQLSQTKKNT